MLGTLDEWLPAEGKPNTWRRVVNGKIDGAAGEVTIVNPARWPTFADYWAWRQAEANKPERRLVPKRVIIDRLYEAGLLAAARKALDAAPLYTRERWAARDAVFADDPESIAFLKAIGADPAVILAP